MSSKKKKENLMAAKKKKERDNLSKILGVDLSQVEAALKSGVPKDPKQASVALQKVTEEAANPKKPPPALKGFAKLMAMANTPTQTPGIPASSEETKGNDQAKGVSEGKRLELAQFPEFKALGDPVVLLCGGTDWETAGRMKLTKGTNSSDLPGPSVVQALQGKRIQKIFTGPLANHSAAVDGRGQVYMWGCNEAGQLGLSKPPVTAKIPMLLSSLKKVSYVAIGRRHTVFVLQDGKVYGCGSSAHGELGQLSGSGKHGIVAKPGHITGLPPIQLAACGADFTLAVGKDGSTWCFGWSEFGQLGLGDDGCHNEADGTIKLNYNAQRTPVRIPVLTGVKIVQVACGAHHCCALSKFGSVYTWGSGDYGKLGHRVQEDLWVPTELEDILATKIYCGHSHSAAVGWQRMRHLANWTPRGNGSLFMWGMVKKTGDSWMYPKIEYDLSGWNIQAMSLGCNHTVVSADKSMISWGTTQCPNLQLGYGPLGPKSSVKPKKIDALEGFDIPQVACGNAHSMWLLENSPDIEKFLPVWDPAEESGSDEDAESSEGEAESKPTKKRGRSGAVKSNGPQKSTEQPRKRGRPPGSKKKKGKK